MDLVGDILSILAAKGVPKGCPSRPFWVLWGERVEMRRRWFRLAETNILQDWRESREILLWSTLHAMFFNMLLGRTLLQFWPVWGPFGTQLGTLGCNCFLILGMLFCRLIFGQCWGSLWEGPPAGAALVKYAEYAIYEPAPVMPCYPCGVRRIYDGCGDNRPRAHRPKFGILFILTRPISPTGCVC